MDWQRMARLSLAGMGVAMAWLLMAVLLVAPARAETASGAAAGATLTIRVKNVEQARGMIRLGLVDAALYDQEDADPVAAADVKAVAGETVITLHDLRPGTYAIQLFHDRNGNGKMDKSWFGFPLEPFGFSRDVKPHLHKPHFADVKFTVAEGENEQTITLQNSISLIAAE